MLLRPIRHAARLLAARPLFTLTTGATIALAIAGNTIVFALIHGIPAHDGVSLGAAAALVVVAGVAAVAGRAADRSGYFFPIAMI